MNLAGIVEEIIKAEPEFPDRVSPRRDAIKNLTGFGAKAAVAALPLALGTLLKKAYGQTPSSAVISALNFALKFEYLEAAFYRVCLAQPSLVIPSSDRAAILAPIAAHEATHVDFLKTALGTSAIAQPADNTYDFTVKGAFLNIFTNYDTFLTVAQTLEDTGVRMYKGQAVTLIKDETYLTSMLNLHSAEARHASAIRYLRRTRGANIKPWVTGTTGSSNDTGIASVDNNYAGENLSVQGTVDITRLPGATTGSTISLAAATEAFDEPLTAAQVLTLLAPFNF